MVEDEVALVAEGGAEAVKEGELVLLLLHLHLHLRLLRLLLRQQMMWPQDSSILQQQEHDDKFSLQCNWVPTVIMVVVVVVVVDVRVTMIHHPQGLVNDLRVLHMFLMRVILVLMLLV